MKLTEKAQNLMFYILYKTETYIVLNQVSMSAAILYLSGKALTGLYEDKNGFLVTATGALVTTYKFAKIDKLKVLAILEFLTVFVFIYGFLKWSEERKVFTISEKMIINYITGLIVLICNIRYLVAIKKNSKQEPLQKNNLDINSLLENLSIAAFAIGTSMIICKNGYGWIGYMVAHTAIGILLYRKKDHVFAIFQLISMIIASFSLIFYILDIKI